MNDIRHAEWAICSAYNCAVDPPGSAYCADSRHDTQLSAERKVAEWLGVIEF